MRRHPYRGSTLLVSVALVAAACTADAGSTTTTTEPGPLTTEPLPTTTTHVPVTTTTEPEVGPALISEGDRNDTVAAFQWLLTCNGFGPLTVDGNFGPTTGAALDASGGAADEGALAALSRTCLEPRPVSPDEPATVVGYTEPGAPALFVMPLTLGTVLSVTVADGSAVEVTVVDSEGMPVEGDGSVWGIFTTADYFVRVDAAPDPTLFTLDISVSEGTLEGASWLIRTNTISHGDITLTLGDPAAATIEKIYAILGHGPRGSHGEFDTGWDFPGQEGFRGILIEGFRFLFVGPNADNPDRPETLSRIRVVEPGVDAAGEPRPFGYVTTPEGVGVGHTLADLITVYGTFVRPGSNADEHYYRLSNQRGELCFYFGATAPTDSSVIVEIATECRR